MQPRLGPKPFSSGNSSEFSFDKVFSVPQVPGGDGTVVEPKETHLEKPDLIPIERPAYFDEPSPKTEEVKVVEETVTTPIETNEDTNVEFRQKMDEEVFKRPTTAERRKVSVSPIVARRNFSLLFIHFSTLINRTNTYSNQLYQFTLINH